MPHICFLVEAGLLFPCYALTLFFLSLPVINIPEVRKKKAGAETAAYSCCNVIINVYVKVTCNWIKSHLLFSSIIS